mmetsp:Transcript_5846/g.17896  ORF Transcript_5846/g.17896 Transcript_5846/m.17896 type:complete len:323 (+) Transcript_5846:1383-2351(+)
MRDDDHGGIRLLCRDLQLRLQLDQLLLHGRHARLRRRQLLQANLVSRLDGGHFRLALGKQRLVAEQQLKVGRGRDIVVAALLRQVARRQLLHALMKEHAHAGQLANHRRIHARQVGKERLCDGQQCVLGPRGEPVDGRAVDERRELAQAVAERVADRRERQHDVQVAPDLRHKERVQRLLGAVHSGLLGAAADVLKDGHQVAGCQQVRHLVRVEQVGDVLHERLLLDLGVGKQEHNGLVGLAGGAQHAPQVVLPLGLAVRLGDLDLEELVLLHERGQPREALPPRAAEPHEQRVATGRRDHSADATHVLERKLEDDQVHRFL